MRKLMGSVLAVLTVLAIPPAALVQTTQQHREAPKTQATTRTPDLSGVWERVSGEGRRTEPLPLTPWAAELYEYNRDPRPGGENRGRIELDPRAGKDCFPPSPNFLMSYQDPFQIVHVSPNQVLIFFEYDHWVRQIWLNEQRPDFVDLTWMGHSIGKWDGDTLVVDTVRMHNGSWFDGAGHVRSTELHMVERFKRASQDRLEIDFTFEDPKAFTKPWSEKRAYTLKPDWKVLERVYCDSRFQKDIYDQP
jgi:hypothetical protein